MILGCLGRIENRLAARQAEDEAAPDEKHRQRGDERGHAQDRDEDAVDEADDRAQHKAEQDRRNDPEIVMVGIENIGEGDADEAEGRPDREVEVLIGDDERHADGHDGIARGIAQQRLEGVGRDEEFGVDEGADDIEQRHHDEEADLPAADELRRAPAERGHR